MIDDLALEREERPEAPVSQEAQTLGRYLRLQAAQFLAKNGSFFATFNGLDQPPSANQFFHTAYPKVSPDFDNQHHVSQGIYMNHFYLGRWLPAQVQRLLFPLEDQMGNRRLTATKMPTTLECHACLVQGGFQQWARNGDWFCLYKARDGLFDTYGEYLTWKRNHDNLVSILETRMLVATENEAANIEAEIDALRRELEAPWIASEDIVPYRR